MIVKQDIQHYKGAALLRGESYLYVPPHQLLRHFISNYTFTFPEKTTMTDQYTIMPTASSTLAFSVNDHAIYSGLRGVNTKPCIVGEYANQFHFLLLIEFHPGGLYPFFKLDQQELRDTSINLRDMNKALHIQIQDAIIQLNSIDALVQCLNSIFLSYIQDTKHEGILLHSMDYIIKKRGTVSVHDLAHEVYYSEKHLNRLFKRYIGTSVKTFSRIARVNHMLRVMDSADFNMTTIAEVGEYFDQSHFIHDFKSICGITPQAYLKNKSIFYNELFKM